MPLSLGLSRAALRSASLMRPCQPVPRLRKCAITSRSRRSDTSCLVGAFCGPRRRRYAATISGATSTAGRMRAHISSVNGGLSGSLRAPARISASSSSVIVASWRNALRRASAHPSFDFLDISPNVRFVRLAQADNPNHAVTTGEDQNVKSVSNKSRSDLTQFAVILSIVDFDDRKGPIEVLSRGEVNFMLDEVERPLCLVPAIERLRCHGTLDIHTMLCRQPKCIYNMLIGAAA